MKTLTIRHVSSELHEALAREKRRRGTSLNQVVLDLLSQRLGVGTERSNGLARLAGHWSDDDLRAFEEAVASVDRVDEDLWR